MPKLGNKYEAIIAAVKVIKPGDTFRHYLSPAEAKEHGKYIASKIGGALREHGVAHSLKRYEHIVVITRLQS